MDWHKGMNEAIDYIEDNLKADIDYSIASKFVCCSVWEFQRVFSFMAKIPLSEYIRRRRLTLAAHDIQNGNEKILDVALKYRYDSHSAFTRAFSQLHGTTPTLARKAGVMLKTYPRISFKFIIQGVDEMDYKIEQKEEMKIIGINKKMNTTDNAHYKEIGTFWHEFEERKLYDSLKKYSVDHNVYAITTYNNEPNSFYYMIGVEYNGIEFDKSYQVIIIPAGMYATFQVPAESEGDVGAFTMRIFNEWLPATGYQLTGGAEIECCTKDGTVILMPIKK